MNRQCWPTRPGVSGRAALSLGRAGVAVVCLALAGLGGAGLSACGESKPGGGAARAPDRGPPQAQYTVRGKIAQVPVPGRPQTEFQVHHEAIDNFADAEGKVVGMGAMVMGFPLGPGVTLDGLAVGDMVELTFPVWWKDGAPDYFVTAIRKLPPETTLEFRPAKPPSP